MPILKTYDISSIAKIKEISEEAHEKRENSTKSEYTIDDIMLVRTTDYLPENGIIKPYSEVPNIIKDQQNFLCDQLYEEDIKTLEQLETYYPYYRTTVHTTENGLVSSHMYGNFDNRNFIILEPLKNQINSNIRNFAGQDTFIKGEMKLSKEALILINSDKYQKLLETYSELPNYNIVIYNGIPKQEKEKYMKDNPDSFGNEINDEEAIVTKVLLDTGYTPEIIGSHYIIQSNTSNNIVELNKKLAAEKGVEANSKHQYSKEYAEDLEVRQKITDKCDRMLADFIIKINNLNIPKKSVVSQNGSVRQGLAEELKTLIGMENLKESVTMFNETIEYMKSKDIFPTPEEFAKNADIDIYNQYNLQQTKTNIM